MMATGWTLPRVGGCHLKLPDTRLVILCKMGDMYVVFSPVLLHWKNVNAEMRMHREII